MSEPVEPDPQVAALQRIADAIENVAFQLETANLLAYNSQPITVVLQQVGRRLGIEMAS